MTLRTKLVLAIAVVGVVPTAGATLVGRELVTRRSTDQWARLLDDAEVEVLTRLRQLREGVTGTVERLADPEDQLIGPLLLSAAQGGVDDDTYRRLALSTPRVMTERGLDVLTVVTPAGVILAAGHFPGRMGDRDQDLARTAAAAASSGGAQLVTMRVMQGRRPQSVLVVHTWRAVSSSLGGRLLVGGGQRLDGAFLRSLRLRGGTEAQLRSPDGVTLAGPTDWGRHRDHPSRVVSLAGPDGQTAARVVLAVADDRLRETLRLINLVAGTLMLCGLVLALLMGAVVARRITRPVHEVVRGAERVAAGDLDYRLQVRGRDEMATLMRAFNRRVAELKESREKLVAAERVAAWREIARRIAHEIKNPLFPIQTSIETLRKVHQKQHPDFEEIFEESTTTILEEVERLKAIVTEFSRFARLPKPELRPCDVGELCTSVQALYAAEDAPPLSVDVPGDLPPALADRDQLTQVLVNLLNNAREALLSGTEDPRVTLTAAAGDGEVTVTVTDNGPGFGADTAGKLFTPYFTTKGQSGGTGLGLAIVHRIVEEHGGSISARSEPGKGATFRVTLPAA